MRDAVAGLVACVVLIANIVSFAVLMFPGPLAAGASTAIWAMLLGSGVAGAWIAWRTSIPPLSTGIDSPTGAALAGLSATASAAVLSAGGGVPAAIQATLLLFTAATALTGALLWGLGAARWGALLRFVPFFVVAGFLAASGWLLLVGGVRMASGHGPGAWLAPWTAVQVAKLACAVGVLAVLLALRRRVWSPLALPVGLLAMTVTGAVVLRTLGLSGPAHGWYLPSLGTLVAWSPLEAWRAEPMPWSTALRFVPETIAVAIVALVSLVTKTASLEVARKTSGDLDQELRAHGVGTLVVAPLGGIVANLQLGTSRLLEQAGGSRLSGVACSLVMLAVGLANLDLPALIPLPIAAGVVLYLGWGFLAEALARPLAQRAWLNVALALAIAVACVRYGFLAGVIGGIVGACLLFAVSYARVGVVRQHLSRAQFPGNVTRSIEAARQLGEAGEAIQLYWLSGYLFFGSSEGVFERVRHDMQARPPGQVRHVIVDFGMVTGADASAPVSLAKLRHLCERQGATLVLSSLTPALRRALERQGVVAADGPAPFDDVNVALAWCEDRLLDAARVGVSGDGVPGFEAWLQQQLGPAVRAADFMAYLERRDIGASQVLYRQGEPSDQIDLVAGGRLGVDVDRGDGRTMRVRSITTHTVVGEMGFFRRAARSATVSSDGPATLYTLTREAFERLRRERPDLAGAFDDFLIRTLSERIVLSERMIGALGR